MINPNDHIRYRNVVSRKYRFHYQDMEEVISDFLHDIDKIKATVKGPLFYSLNNVPKDEIVHVELFMPVEEDYLSIMDDMYFHSYYSIEDMVSLTIFSNFERDTEVAYAELMNYIEEKGLRQTTPIFHVIAGDTTMQYTFIKMGVC